MTGDDTPRYVVATTTDAAAVLRRLARDGWSTRDGFALPEGCGDLTAARLALSGRVPDLDTVRLVLLAAARGAAVVAISDTGGDVGRALLADLARLGPVQQGPTAATRPGPAVPLVPEQRALLERLARGETIAAAAAAEFLSLRTANRRIAQARAALGVPTTREAVLAYLRQRRPD